MRPQNLEGGEFQFRLPC